MKRTCIITFLIIVSCVKLNYGTQQPPYNIKDRYINENFRVIYFSVSQHTHNGVDSAKLQTVLPDSGATYDLGDSTSSWRNIFISNQLAFTGYTKIQIRALVPLSRGCITWDSTDGKFYYSTGTVAGAWAKISDNSAP